MSEFADKNLSIFDDNLFDDYSYLKINGVLDTKNFVEHYNVLGNYLCSRFDNWEEVNLNDLTSVCNQEIEFRASDDLKKYNLYAFRNELFLSAVNFAIVSGREDVASMLIANEDFQPDFYTDITKPFFEFISNKYPQVIDYAVDMTLEKIENAQDKEVAFNEACKKLQFLKCDKIKDTLRQKQNENSVNHSKIQLESKSSGLMSFVKSVVNFLVDCLDVIKNGFTQMFKPKEESIKTLELKEENNMLQQNESNEANIESNEKDSVKKDFEKGEMELDDLEKDVSEDNSEKISDIKKPSRFAVWVNEAVEKSKSSRGENSKEQSKGALGMVKDISKKQSLNELKNRNDDIDIL